MGSGRACPRGAGPYLERAEAPALPSPDPAEAWSCGARAMGAPLLCSRLCCSTPAAPGLLAAGAPPRRGLSRSSAPPPGAAFPRVLRAGGAGAAEPRFAASRPVLSLQPLPGPPPPPCPRLDSRATLDSRLDRRRHSLSPGTLSTVPDMLQGAWSTFVERRSDISGEPENRPSSGLMPS